MREFFTIAIFKIKADIRMNKTTLNSQKEKHSTLSLRRATAGAKATANATWNFYPRSPCGERRAYSLPSSTISTISIHALLAESDHKYPRGRYGPGRISIHALLAESDASLEAYMRALSQISIHALLAESDLCNCLYPMRAFISIHALLAESDQCYGA